MFMFLSVVAPGTSVSKVSSPVLPAMVIGFTWKWRLPALAIAKCHSKI